MIRDLEHAEELAQQHNTTVEDVLYIALNAMGLSNAPDNISRMRVYSRSFMRPEKEFRFILATDRDMSPFSIKQSDNGSRQLVFDGKSISEIRDENDDAAVFGYFRGANKEIITLNSNSRSHCTGCVFCPNTLEGASDPDINDVIKLVTNFSFMLAANGLQDLSGVKEVNLSTGCFETEERAINHLRVVRKALTKLNCTAQIGMLTSVIRTQEAFDRIATEVGDFNLILTAECFDQREEILKDSKASLTPDQIPGVLERARNAGHDTSFTYIVGLDELETLKKYTALMATHVSRFPNFQVYQPHDPLMDMYAAEGTTDLDFYLQARTHIEEIFAETDIRPSSDTNYRPLWYYNFGDESLVLDKDIGAHLDDGHNARTPQVATTAIETSPTARRIIPIRDMRIG